jgi:hypothetical protein
MNLKTIGLLTLGFCAGAVAHVALAQSRGVIADAPVAVPDKYQVELENEYVRVVRVRYPAHSRGALHAHPSPGALIVPLTDQDASSHAGRIEARDSRQSWRCAVGRRDSRQRSVDLLGTCRKQPRRFAVRNPENRAEGRGV